MNIIKVGRYFLMEVPDIGFDDHPILTNERDKAMRLSDDAAMDWADELGGTVERY